MYQFPPVTARVAKLRAEYRDTIPYIDSERTRILTEYYKANPHEVDIIKRAKALYNILTQCTIHIDPEELIVGNTGKYSRNCMVFAEYNSVDWIKRELETGVFDKRTSQEGVTIMPEEDREYFLSVADFWHENCVGGITGSFMPPEYETVAMTGTLTHGPWMRNQTHGHYNTNIRKAVDTGFGAIKKEAQEKLREMHGKIDTDKAEKFFFYNAVIICCDAAIAYSKRFAAEARRLYELETNEKRRAELLKIAECMDWIMENPARNFYEAVEACYLYTLILCLEGAFLGLTIGRFDQHVGDYLERELEEGTITEAEAQEIVDCYCLKVGNLIGSGAREFMTAAGAYSNNMRLTLGGRKKDGTDASNHVTYMTLNSMARLKLHDPNTSLCVHDETPLSLWQLGIETNKLCGGNPTIDNTDLMIDIMLKRGLELEDARNFCLIGCVELSGSGCDWCNVSGPFSKAFMTFPNVVLQAINNGINPANGKPGGLQTGYLYEMETFEDVKKAFSDQLEYVMNWHLTFDTLIEYTGNPRVPLPIASATMDGCMESGRDMMTGGAKYNSTGTAAIGIGTTIDSLVAIKYAVYDKKFCTSRELYDAIMANWEGYEDLRMRIQNETPFFGNGDEYSDEIATFVSSEFADRAVKLVGPRGEYHPGLYSAGVHVGMGKAVYATPNGRKAGDPLSDGASPSQSADKNGPTGVVKSILALHPEKYLNGMQFNMKFHPSCVSGEDGFIKLKNFIEAFFQQGGMQVQYNIVSSDTLRKAQEDPYEYRDLVVRVAGFSAYFTELVPELQNDLISRTDNMM